MRDDDMTHFLLFILDRLRIRERAPQPSAFRRSLSSMVPFPSSFILHPSSLILIVLAILAFPAFSGCTTLNPAWFSGKTTADSDATPIAPQQTAAHEAPKPEPSASARPDDPPTTDYMRELAAGVELEQARQYPEARKHYEQLIRQWPARWEAYHHLGQVCDRQKRYAEAQENYQRAIRLAENREPDLFNDLGYSFFLTGSMKKAENAIRKAVALRPSEPKYHNNLGLILGHQRRFDDAWKEFRLAGGEADACYNLAFVKASLGDFAGAKECFHRALAIDPTHDQARRALRAFELAETDPDSLAQLATSNDDDTKWVLYVENAQDQETSAGAGGPRDRNAADTAPNSSITSRNARTARGG